MFCDHNYALSLGFKDQRDVAVLKDTDSSRWPFFKSHQKQRTAVPKNGWLVDGRWSIFFLARTTDNQPSVSKAFRNCLKFRIFIFLQPGVLQPYTCGDSICRVRWHTRATNQNWSVCRATEVLFFYSDLDWDANKITIRMAYLATLSREQSFTTP